LVWLFKSFQPIKSTVSKWPSFYYFFHFRHSKVKKKIFSESSGKRKIAREI
jgi:hypothetical protein